MHIPISKVKKKEPKDKAPQKNIAPPKPPKLTPPCALSDVVGNATHNCLELPHLKPMVEENFL